MFICNLMSFTLLSSFAVIMSIVIKSVRSNKLRCCKLASWFMRHGGLGINHLCWNTYLYNHRRRVQTEQRLKHAGKVWSCKFRCESLLPKTKPGRCGQWSSWRNKDGSNWRHWPHALPEWPISFRSVTHAVSLSQLACENSRLTWVGTIFVISLCF